RELVTLSPEGAFAFRYRSHPPDETIALQVSQARYDVGEVVATVVSRALVEVVLGEDLTATYRCRYRIKSTERQRLGLELPMGLEVLSVLIDGSEGRLEPDPSPSTGELWDAHYVNISRQGPSDAAFTLTLQFLWTVNPKPFDRGMQGTIKLPLPRVGDPRKVAVQQTRVVVWAPEDYAFIGSPRGFTQLGRTLLGKAFFKRPAVNQASADDEWLDGNNKVLLEFPTTGRVPYRYANLGGDLQRDPTITLLWWNTVWFTVVISVALAVIAWVLLRTSWENKLGVLLLLLFVGVLLGLKDETLVAHVAYSARFGLLFLLGLWLVGAVVGRRGRTSAPEHDTVATAGNASSAGAATAAVVPPPGVFEPHHSEGPPDHDRR
ncbi:MAG: hypothetical protein KF861_15935, partial [Planctomycetaceae bacterium]|nr:hypothetical protein [Planctomycetaceae bacterium]